MKIHIGEKIKQRAKQLRIGVTELGKSINTSKQNVTGIYKRKSIDVSLLSELCEVLRYDFFQHYRPSDKTVVDKRVKLLEAENARLKKVFQEKEIEYLRKINSLLIKQKSKT